MSTRSFDLSGKVAAVTGASANGGIGHAIAVGLAQYGADVVVSDIDDQGVARTGNEIRDLGCQTLVAHCDISNFDEVRKLFDEIDNNFKSVDILVNVPFYYPRRVKPHELQIEELMKTLSVNYVGYFMCTQFAIDRMLKKGEGGSIISIGSTAGISALGRGNFPYSCSKGAVCTMTKELAVEYASKGIRVNAIIPAQVMTPGFKQALLDDPRFAETILPVVMSGLPIGRLLEPEDFIGPAVFLASEASSAITGVLLPVDGGNLALNPSGSHTWPEDA